MNQSDDKSMTAKANKSPQTTNANGGAATDIDPQETLEWLEALEAVIEQEGPERAHFLLEQLIDKSRRSGANLPYNASTAYVNTIPPHLEARSPGDFEVEHRIRSMVRWNATAMVCLLYTSPSPRDATLSRMPSSA